MEEATSRSRLAPGRSCIACRRRKIRCDRNQPCNYCTKFKLQCSYPDPTQESRKQPENEVLSRLDRIEALLLETRATNSGSSSRQAIDRPSDGAFRAGTYPQEHGNTNADHHNHARYVTSSFWPDLGGMDKEEAAELTNVAPPSAPSQSETPHHGFIFGFNTTNTDLKTLHPDHSRIFTLWQVFLDSVDPVLKVIHVPTVQRQMIRATQDLASVPPVFESLMFSIYLAAVTSMQNKTVLHEERQTLIERYRFGVEQALAKARFMSSPDVPALQALTLFLLCIRYSTDKTYVWSMTGLLTRLAMKVGLHRDPETLGLSPFMSELRRRLWWQILILDVRIAEDNDMDPFIYEHMFDTRRPANVNDSDLDLSMAQPPSKINKWTEMTYTLTRFEVSYAARKLVFSPKFTADNGCTALSLKEKIDMIDSVHRHVEEQYLKDCDINIPLCWLAATATRITLSKIKLTVHHPARTGPTMITEETLINLVSDAIGIIEYAQALRSSEKYSQWVWLFQTYIEWDGVAFLLHALAVRPLPTFGERAWRTIDTFFEHWKDHALPEDKRWRQLQNLRAKASASQSPNSRQADMTLAASSSGRQQTLIGDSVPLDSTMLSMPHIDDLSSAVQAGCLATAPATSDDVYWNFDNALYMQGAPSWEMDLDENAFKTWF